MPSSGARSGTPPSRAGRGAGTGKIEETILLKCGHQAEAEPVIVYPLNSRRYWCEACRKLVREK